MPVWQEAFELADEIYNIVEKFPKSELYALSSQIKRSVISISANIAESYGRHHTLEKSISIILHAAQYMKQRVTCFLPLKGDIFQKMSMTY